MPTWLINALAPTAAAAENKMPHMWLYYSISQSTRHSSLLQTVMPQIYSTSLFITPGSSSSLASSSLDSTATPSSIHTTTTSRTIPGIGSLGGRFIYSFGKTVLRGFESVAIRRRLTYIESLFPLSDNNPLPNIESVYDDLLELVRCVKIYFTGGEDGAEK